jgi:Fur family transcriptional regulator, peroxide stress response regulator
VKSDPDILELLREAGLRCTPQRYGVLEYLLKHPVHPTADALWRSMNRKDPRASRATVYNSLRSLIEAGLARELPLDGKAARFDAIPRPHHHFVCDRCGRIEDIAWFRVEGLERRAGLGRRRLRDFEMVLRGDCEKCREIAKEEKS